MIMSVLHHEPGSALQDAIDDQSVHGVSPADYNFDAQAVAPKPLRMLLEPTTAPFQTSLAHRGELRYVE
jgi:hypothetical protein